MQSHYWKAPPTSIIGRMLPSVAGNAIDSPFENGLTYPPDDGYALEIVHPNTN